MPVVRLALAQMNAVVGALGTNTTVIQSFLKRAEAEGADLLVTPELALTGYPPEDLLLKDGFVRAVHERLNDLALATGTTALAVGTPLSLNENALELAPALDGRRNAVRGFSRRSGPLANSLAVFSQGAHVATATKRLLPNYDVFDEQRYFHAGVGPLSLLNLRGVPVGLLICEDVWTPEGPVTQLAAQGAALIVVANASPFARGRRREREEMIAERARATKCAVAYVNLVGGQDELVFDGQSFVVDADGTVVARAPSFEDGLLVVDFDLPESALGTPVVTSSLEREPVAISVTAPLSDLEEIYRALVVGTHDYIVKNFFTSAVVNLSGGVDSALVAVIAADALGSSRVRCFALPSRFSSEHSVADAEELAMRTGVSLTNLSIEEVHRAFAVTLAGALDEEPSGVTDENLQSRIRGVLLMALSNATGAIALTTGNKSELATGYFTLYGDSVGGFAVIKDVPKTLVYELCRWRNQDAARRGEVEPFPESILTKPPSAELRADQRDDQSLPAYEELDPLLEMYVEGDATAQQMIEAGHDADLVARVVGLVDRSEYKRRQMPPGVRVSRKAFGRDRRMPITNLFGSEGQ